MSECVCVYVFMGVIFFDIYILILCFYHLIFSCGISMEFAHSFRSSASLIRSFVWLDYLIWTGTFAVGDMDMVS